MDGFIAGAAALIAVGIQPLCRDFLIASHRSGEHGHLAILDHLGLKALLDLELRLGEGTGACLGMDLLCAAIKIYTEMATFEEAGVCGKAWLYGNCCPPIHLCVAFSDDHSPESDSS